MDSAIGNNHVTVPDLIDPILGFRGLSCNHIDIDKIDSQIKQIETCINDFHAPAAYRMEPGGRLVPDLEAIEEARVQFVGKNLQTLKELKELREQALIAPVQLESSHETVWFREMVARCGKGQEHLAPDPDCECGLYCYYKPTGSFEYGNVGAIVTCWGKIEAHSTGMRVQYMKVQALIDRGLGFSHQIAQVANAWEVPYISPYRNKSDILSIALEFGSLIPESMKPHDSE